MIATEKQNEPTTSVAKEKGDENEAKVTHEPNQDLKETDKNEQAVIDISDANNGDENNKIPDIINISDADNENVKDVIDISEEKSQDCQDSNANNENVKDVIDISDANNENVKDIIDISEENSQDGQDNKSEVQDKDENKDVKMETITEAVKENAGKSVTETLVATPTRSSSRLANIVPSSIKTRRASRLAQ